MSEESSLPPSQLDAFLDRAMRYLDGLLTPQEGRLLNQELASSEQLRDAFIEICDIRGRLLEYQTIGQLGYAIPSAAAELETDVELFSTPDRSVAIRVKRSQQTKQRMITGLAAVFILLLGIAAYFMSRPTVLPTALSPNPSQGVGIIGHITKAVDCQWKEKHMFTAVGTPLGVGQLDLLSGTVELTMGKDVRVVLTGPVRADLRSPSDVFLHQGKITAEVGPDGVGFSVNTKSAHVVDLGTAFGVFVTLDGVTETHVLRGKVQLQPTAKGAAITNLVAGNAFAVSAGSAVAKAIEFRPTLFVEPKKFIDLADIVAGGDGTQEKRGVGIDVTTGAVYAGEPPTYSFWGDGKFHPVPGRPMIGGVFLPSGSQPVQLDPAGHTFSDFPKTDNQTWYTLWAGGRIPLTRPVSGARTPPSPTVLGTTDFAEPGRNMIFMHASKGIAFDLTRIRITHPEMKFGGFRAICQNTLLQVEKDVQPNERFDVWVFVDGELRFSRQKAPKRGAAFEIDVELKPTDRYLTLVATDAGDGVLGDWVTLGDPRLE